VHCAAGRSRAAAVVVAYLMLRERLSCERAIEDVCSKWWICPNVGFKQQLELFEKLGCSLSRWPQPASPVWPKRVSHLLLICKEMALAPSSLRLVVSRKNCFHAKISLLHSQTVKVSVVVVRGCRGCSWLSGAYIRHQKTGGFGGRKFFLCACLTLMKQTGKQSSVCACSGRQPQVAAIHTQARAPSTLAGLPAACPRPRR
jgi:hypothetical protein